MKARTVTPLDPEILEAVKAATAKIADLEEQMRASALFVSAKAGDLSWEPAPNGKFRIQCEGKPFIECKVQTRLTYLWQLDLLAKQAVKASRLALGLPVEDEQ